MQPEVCRLVTLIENCYISSLINIETNAKTENVDLITVEILRRVIKQKKISIIRVDSKYLADIAYNLLNAAFDRIKFKYAKCAIVMADCEKIEMSDDSKIRVGQPISWHPRSIKDLIDMPTVIIFYGEINGFSQYHFPLFSHVDARLMLNGYFTRKELEVEFILATSYSRRKRKFDLTSRTTAEMDAVQALQVNISHLIMEEFFFY